MKVKLLNSSQNAETNDRISTFVLEDFPKFLLAELNTHALSRNAESSRARPIASIHQQAIDDPYIPLWTANQPGMVGAEVESDDVIKNAEKIWLELRDFALEKTGELQELGIHKQDMNRPLEAWLKVSVIITSTDFFWQNFFALRDNEAAQPAFRAFASIMHDLYKSEPKILQYGEWHKPWADLDIYENTARAAGISYKNHTTDFDYDRRKATHDALIAASPMHGSPLEHCALAHFPGMYLRTQSKKYQIFDHFHPVDTLKYCDPEVEQIVTTKFEGFTQYRKLVELGIGLDYLL